MARLPKQPKRTSARKGAPKSKRAAPKPPKVRPLAVGLAPIDIGDVLFPIAPIVARNLTKTVLRPDDLLSLRFEFVNLKRVKDGDADVLVRRTEDALAYVIVHFAPQNIAEQAFFQTAPSYTPPDPPPGKPPLQADPDKSTGNEEPTPPPVQSRIAGPSRLVFLVPLDEDQIPYTLDGLLDCIKRYQLSVAPVALPPPQLPNLKRLFALSAQSVAVLQNVALQREGEPEAQPRDIADALAESNALLLQRRSVTAQRIALAVDADVRAQVARLIDSILILPPRIAQPALTHTAIELPYRLIVSPNKFAAWFHANQPVTSSETRRTELWHTRLGTRTSPTATTEADHPLRAIRAIWTRDPSFNKDDSGDIPDHDNEPFRMSLDGFDRHQIVHLTSNFTIVTPKLGNAPRKRYTPMPVDVDSLMLSALGAWLNSRGMWDPPRLSSETSLSVEEWRHRGTMGRDHYVRVVYQGYLFPFGHRAALVKITERKFHRKKIGSQFESIAYLRQRMYIVVRQPEKLFGGTGLVTAAGASYDRQFPFTRVRLTTLVTPDLDVPDLSEVIPGKKQSIFWPRVGAQDFQFHLIAEDLDGREVEFTLPLMFVDRSEAFAAATGNAAQANYATNTANTAKLDKNRRFASVKGQKLAFATAGKPGDTAFEVNTLEFASEVPLSGLEAALGADHPRFYPAVRSAAVIVPAIKQLANNASAPKVEFHPEFLKKGFSNNPGEVFLRLAQEAGNTFEMRFSSQGDRSGGLVQPDMTITGLSRKMGVVAGDLNNFVQGAGQFDPKNFFAALSPLMFGCVKLTDILAAVGLDVAELVPRFVTEQLTGAQALLNDLARLQGLGNQLKSQAAGVQAKVDAVLADGMAIAGDLGALLANPLGSTAALLGHLNDFKTYVSALLAEFGGPNLANVDRGLLKDAEAALARFQSELDDVPKYLDLLQSALQLPEELRVKFEWKPKLADWGLSPGDPIVIFNKPNKDNLLIAIEVRAKSSLAAAPKAQVLCRLEKFTLDLIAPASFIRLRFDHVEFLMLVGKKPDVDVKLADIEFVGVLAFVEALKSLIPLDGFSDPPSLTVSEKGVAASFSIALPGLTLGVMALTNLSLGAAFTVPFIGEPLSVRFNFCERHNPFTLQVWLFGGGGFFALTLDPHGVQILEAAFEFGATVSIDFGVASGGVHVMAGIYFKIESDEAQLTGYFRMGGHVSVLGIVSVSIELYLELRYEFSSGKCVGKAVLTIEVSLFFFSISAKIECERKFAGSNGDPTFAQILAPSAWDEYCEAFA